MRLGTISACVASLPERNAIDRGAAKPYCHSAKGVFGQAKNGGGSSRLTIPDDPADEF